MVSWVYFGQKSLMNGFIGNTLMFYFIFVDGLQWNSDKKMVVFTCYFGDKNLKTCGGIHWNTGFFGGVEGLRPQLHQKKPGFNETNTQVSSSYSKVSRETIIFWSEFHWNRQQKKKMSGFPLKPVKLFFCFCETIFGFNNFFFREILKAVPKN